MKKLKIEKSHYPDGEKDHLIVLYSNTKYGRGFKRLFKGTKDECEREFKILNDELESGIQNNKFEVY